MTAKKQQSESKPRPPDTDQLVFYTAIAGLAVIGLVEWPVAVLVGVGHMLASNRSNRAVAELGEALENA